MTGQMRQLWQRTPRCLFGFSLSAAVKSFAAFFTCTWSNFHDVKSSLHRGHFTMSSRHESFSPTHSCRRCEHYYHTRTWGRQKQQPRVHKSTMFFCHDEWNNLLCLDLNLVLLQLFKPNTAKVNSWMSSCVIQWWLYGVMFWATVQQKFKNIVTWSKNMTVLKLQTRVRVIYTPAVRHGVLFLKQLLLTDRTHILGFRYFQPPGPWVVGSGSQNEQRHHFPSDRH